MDALIVALGNFCSQLLPILGAVALVFLCIVLNRAWKLLESLKKTVDNLDPTLKKVDQSIEKVQTPLDTVVKLSHSIDDMQKKSSDGLAKASTVVNDNVDKLKTFISDKFGKAQHNYETIVDDEEVEEKNNG